MRIGICEDDKVSRDFEELLIHRWAEKNECPVIVDLFSSAENFLFESEDRMEYDFLILDIQLGKMNGFELAKTLRKRGFSGFIAFLTGVMDYAIEGYEVGAIRYILKPVNEQCFFQVLDAVYRDFKNSCEKMYLLQIGNDVSRIPFDNIVYIEARGHYVHLCGIENGKDFFEKEWKTAFGRVTADFEDKGFFCLRRGFLVNLRHVVKITKTECLLSNGENIPVARNNYVDLNRAFIEYYKGVND